MSIISMVEYVDVAGGLILNSANEVLLVYNQGTDTWTFPKGHVEVGEEYLETALREVSEETGINDLMLVRELPVYERVTRQKENKIKVMHLYLFKSQTNEVNSKAKDVSSVMWVTIDKVISYFTYQEDIDFFNKIKEQITQK